MAPKLDIKNVGQIAEASLTFGDLTVFVGPQATGKSIALQIVKLTVDAGQVQEEMRKYGLDWSRDLSRFLDVYFGEGMHGIWKTNSSIHWGGVSVDLEKLARRQQRTKIESLLASTPTATDGISPLPISTRTVPMNLSTGWNRTPRAIQR